MCFIGEFLTMKTLRLFVFSFSLLIACTLPATAGPWDGEYEYGGYGGRTAGGSAIMMEVTVSINSPKLKQACVFQAIGFQTDTKIFCTAAIKGDVLEVQFKSYSDGGILNEFGNERYKVGEVLLTLKKPKDKKNQYAVRWGSYVPFDDMSQADKFFEKSK